MPLYNVLFTKSITYVKEIEAPSEDLVYDQIDQFPNVQGIIDGNELTFDERWSVELV